MELSQARHEMYAQLAVLLLVWILVRLCSLLTGDVSEHSSLIILSHCLFLKLDVAGIEIIQYVLLQISLQYRKSEHCIKYKDFYCTILIFLGYVL